MRSKKSTINNTDPEDNEVLEDDNEEDKNENLIEAQDFMYFKQQCKFEKFVTQFDNSKGPDALRSFFGGYVNDAQHKISDEEIGKEVVGFDTRFWYTKEGLLVYDVNSNI